MPSPRSKATFFDSLLGVDCRFLRAGDGELRCMPASDLPEYLNSKVYSDAACTTELSYVPAACSPAGRLQLQFDHSTCPGRIRHWKLGAALPATTPVFRRFGTTCTVSGEDASRLFPRVGEADYATFLRASQVDGESRSGFTEVRLVAEDGAVQVLGFRWAGAGPVVQPRLAADGHVRLLSVDASDATLEFPMGEYSDAACTTVAALGPGSCATVGPSALKWVPLTNRCGWGEAVFEVGARLDVLHDRTWGTCEPVEAGRLTGFAVGAEIPAGTFPGVPLVPFSGRLSRPAFAVGEGWRWLEGGVFDTSNGSEMIPGIAADGVERWIPIQYQRGSLYADGTPTFADAGCTIPLGSPPNQAPSCVFSKWYIADSSAIACSPEMDDSTRFFERGAPHTGPTWELRSYPATCSPSTSTASLFEVGPEIPAATFAAVVLERR
jgi:hypothetical protein